jgi:hypothetical protein
MMLFWPLLIIRGAALVAWLGADAHPRRVSPRLRRCANATPAVKSLRKSITRDGASSRVFKGIRDGAQTADFTPLRLCPGRDYRIRPTGVEGRTGTEDVHGYATDF